MRTQHWLVVAVLVACQSFSVPIQALDTSGLVGDPAAGAFKADDERCRECHGDHGEIKTHGSNEATKIPRLAGQHPQYLLKQLRDFASGARKYDFMNRIAADIAAQDAVDIIAHFTRPEFDVRNPKESTDFTDESARANAQRIYQQGDSARGLPSCASCHGADGRSTVTQPEVVAELIPVVAGQDRYYLQEQLLNWRSGARSNSPAGIMNRAVQGLSDSEINALAIYLEGL